MLLDLKLRPPSDAASGLGFRPTSDDAVATLVASYFLVVQALGSETQAPLFVAASGLGFRFSTEATLGLRLGPPSEAAYMCVCVCMCVYICAYAAHC